MRKAQNSEKIEGRIYQHDLVIKQVQNEQSANFGKDFISGNLEIATDENMLNVIPVHFTYVTPETKKGVANKTYAVLKQIIDNNETCVSVGKDDATKVRIDTAIALNDFYNQNDELVSVKTNEGGFVTIITSLSEDESTRNVFSADMVINGISKVDANEEKKIDEHIEVKGAVFNFRNDLLPVSFVVESEAGMKYFENMEATNAKPVYTRVWGNIVSKTIETTQEIESAFGEPAVRTYTNRQKAWVITGTAVTPYDFGDENVLTAAELEKAVQDRQVYLADVKKRAEEYKANNSTAAAGATASTVKEGGFVF